VYIGGVDVLSRLLANVEGKHPNRKLHGSLRERLIMTNLSAAHLCSRARTFFEECPGHLRDKYSSVGKFKKYLNGAQSFKEFLSSVCDRSQDNDFFYKGGVVHTGTAENDSLPAGAATVARFSSARATLATASGNFLRRRTNMAGHFVATTKKNGRCAVCCARCDSGASANTSEEPDADSEEPIDHYQYGRLTRHGCFTCYKKLWHAKKNTRRKRKRDSGGRADLSPVKELRDDKLRASKHLFRLCDVARYTHKDDNRTCFEIHHQTAPDYPEYTGCMRNHKGQKKHDDTVPDQPPPIPPPL
jgi:hypothetical protein